MLRFIGKRRPGKGERGQTTIFLSLILVMVVSLVFTLLESARSDGLQLRMQLAADAAISSAFASYQKELWDDYGLLLFADRQGDGAEMREMIAHYAALNTSEENAPGGDWIALGPPEVSELKYMLITDDHGEVFISAAGTFMKECGLIKEAVDLSERWDEAMDKVNSVGIFNADGEIDLGGLGDMIERANETIQNAGEETGGDEGGEDGSSDPEDGDGGGNGEAGSNAGEGGDADSSGDGSEEESPPSETDPSDAFDLFLELMAKFFAWKRIGLLMLVCDNVDEISEKPFDKDPLPSSADSSVKDRLAGEPMSHGVVDNMILREYLMGFFNSYRDDHKDRLELEYLVAGKDSDLANLSSTVKRLAGIRTALNYIFLKTHEDYKAELTAIAAAIAALFGNAKVIDVAKEVLALIWAFAESISDVRALLGGKKVALIKDETQWKLTIRNVAADALAGEGSSGGMNYEEYMRLLLYIRGSETLAYRAMDCIQLRMNEKDSSFLMKNCIYAARAKLEAAAPSLFPFLPEKLDYLVSAQARYSYGKVSY